MRGRTTASARIVISVVAPLLLIGALCWPLLFSDATFNEDWLNHLWYMWHQSLAIRAEHHPSLFLSYSDGVLYPFYAFYGGTIYALTGTLSLALGNAPLTAYIVTYLLGFAVAYGGWLWMARMFGVRGWLAHVPGLIFVTSASYLTMIYGLGDWPEFLAVSAMPLTVASGLSVLQSPRLRIWPALALVGSTTMFFDSHLLTAIWGTTCLVLVGAAIVLCIPEARSKITRTGVLGAAGLIVPSVLLSAWCLLPAAAYESHTVTAHSYPFHDLLQKSMYTVAARHLFTFSRAKASGTIVTLALPILAIAWAIGSTAILLWTRRRGPWIRALLLVAGATTLLIVLMTHAGLIVALPRIYAIVEFSFRLESYVLMGVCGMVLIALVLTADEGPWMRRWRWLLAPVAIVSLIGAIEQVNAYKSGMTRSAALSSFLSPTFEQEGLLDYVDDELPIVRTRLPVVNFPPSSIHGDRAVKLLYPHGARRFDTNLRSGPDLLHVVGARIVATDSHADDILEIASPQARAASVRITVSASNHLPVLAGRLLTILALLTLIAELVLIAVQDRRNRLTAWSIRSSQRQGDPSG